MPLRDHFHAPLFPRRKWEPFHAGWANSIARRLSEAHLPPGYYAETELRLGTLLQIDAAARHDGTTPRPTPPNGEATSPWAAGAPTQTIEVAIPEEDTFEVQVLEEPNRLVAAIELVSPSNKKSPEERRSFAAKVVSYLRGGVCAVVVDVVTERHSDLYEDILAMLGHERGQPWPGVPPLYALTLRYARQQGRMRLESWEHPLALGEQLPTMPLWLSPTLSIPLELEWTYQDAYRHLRLP
jgi:hypothetical protein